MLVRHLHRAAGMGVPSSLRFIVLAGLLVPATAGAALGDEVRMEGAVGAGERGLALGGRAELRGGFWLVGLEGHYGFGMEAGGPEAATHHAGYTLRGRAGAWIHEQVALLAGAQIDDGGFSMRRRLAGLVAVRWWAAPASVELGVSHIISGRDRPHVRHMELAPGWYLQLRTRYVLSFGAEVGITGLGYRDAMGSFRPEAYARAFVGWGFEL